MRLLRFPTNPNGLTTLTPSRTAMSGRLIKGWLTPSRSQQLHSLPSWYTPPHRAAHPRRWLLKESQPSSARRLVTLAIETSCDDTCVAVLERHPSTGAARLHFNEKITSDNRAFRGVHPTTSVLSHSATLADLARKALSHIPRTAAAGEPATDPPKPDFVTVTRGPGMVANLAMGLATAKGLAVAWGVPLLGVNHMQAHALTPRLVTALEKGRAAWPETDGTGAPQTGAGSAAQKTSHEPSFPFLSLLVSGGHTMLLLSRSLCSHRILVPDAGNLAIGDMLDKCARDILPSDILAAVPDTMYGAALESFAFPDAPAQARPGHDRDYDYGGYAPPARRNDELRPFVTTAGAVLTPPLAASRARIYNLTGFGTQVSRAATADPDMSVPERRELARATMRLAFEHLTSRILFSLDGEGPGMAPGVEETEDLGGEEEGNGEGEEKEGRRGLREELAAVRTLVVSGGVASNRFLMRVLRSTLDARGHGNVAVVAPPRHLCTDNAAMIAWAGMEMWDAGWETDLSATAVRKWSLDPGSEDGGILGLPAWVRRDGLSR